MKIFSFIDLEKDIADKSASLDEQRRLITHERMLLKKIWLGSLTSPHALLMSLSIGFVAGYFRKPKAAAKERPYGRFSKTRAKFQSALIDFIKRFSSGIIVGIISSISSRKGQQLSIIPQEEQPLQSDAPY